MLALALVPVGVRPPSPTPAGPGPSGCLSCHRGIESIRDAQSGMMTAIRAKGRGLDDPAGCIVCHGGNPGASTTTAAHAMGRAGGFRPDPGSPWVNGKACGPCHMKEVQTQWSSLMMTGAGLIEGALQAWVTGDAAQRDWGIYAARNPDEGNSRRGSDRYRSVMADLAREAPRAYPPSHQSLAEAQTTPAEVARDAARAGFAYARTQCARCHLGVRGWKARGDHRGMGCSACHVPYGTEGYYEGSDPTTPKDQPGHPLVHAIQSGRAAPVRAGKVTYSGIPVNTCAACHYSSKRIAMSYQGLVESPSAGPFDGRGNPQPGLHLQRYSPMPADAHLEKGMLCGDCHTTIDLHGDGFLAGAALARVEIECTDCHGTPRAFPWDLPLRHGDEYGSLLPRSERRGTAKGDGQADGQPHLLTARGNPMPKVTRDGDEVVVHTAGGADVRLAPLRLRWRQADVPLAARVSMDTVARHLDRMECYACHAPWAPQHYGMNVLADFRPGGQAFDWALAANWHARPENRTASGEADAEAWVPGAFRMLPGVLQWGPAPLMVNGEGRISPALPLYCGLVTVMAPSGAASVRNTAFLPPGDDGEEPGLSLTPAQPHTGGPARTCESCHVPDAPPTGPGRSNPAEPLVVDLRTADGSLVPRRTRSQLPALPAPTAGAGEMSRRFPLARPLTDAERALIDQRGVCAACHQETPSRFIAPSLLHHVAQATGLRPRTSGQHQTLVRVTLLTAAWAQVLAAVLVPAGLVLWVRRRRSLAGRYRRMVS